MRNQKETCITIVVYGNVSNSTLIDGNLMVDIK